MPVRLASSLLAASIASAADPVFTLHPDQVLRRDADRWIGINLNYIRDADANRQDGARPLSDALTDLGARWLRYPGGEKSDHHRFAPPPYTRPEPVALGWYAKQTGSRMDFDAYIASCRTLGAEPYVVVPCTNTSAGPATWDEQVAHAAAWVRYANVIKGYGVKTWEIGNENWHKVGVPTAEVAAQVVRTARAMRAVDPTIHLGSSGDRGWWAEFLPIAAGDLDFLSVSVYSTFDWKSYERILRAPEPDLLGAASDALRAIAALPNAADRERLTVRVAETNSVDYSEGGWAKTNCLGHALVTFEGFGRLLREPRIACALLWNTRWMDDTEAPGNQFYGLDAANRLLPSGQAVGLWGRHLHPHVIAIDGAVGHLRAHASATADGGAWTVWLVNRGLEPATGVTVALGGLPAATINTHCFHGTGADDPNPVLDPPTAIQSDNGVAGPLELPALSITVITGGR